MQDDDCDCSDPDCEIHRQMENGLSREEALAKFREKEKAAFDRDGWYGHMVNDALDTPTGVNYHTHGLPESCGHPDLQLICPLPMTAIDYIFKAIISRIKDGTVYRDGDVAENVSNGYSVKLVSAFENGREVLRIIIPDKYGNIDQGTIKGSVLSKQYDDLA